MVAAFQHKDDPMMFRNRAQERADAAFEKARDAYDGLKTHEAVCSERWGAVIKRLDVIDSGQRKAQWWIIGVLLAIVGALAKDVIPHIHLG